jgi:hypothetical protein
MVLGVESWCVESRVFRGLRVGFWGEQEGGTKLGPARCAIVLLTLVFQLSNNIATFTSKSHLVSNIFLIGDTLSLLV